MRGTTSKTRTRSSSKTGRTLAVLERRFDGLADQLARGISWLAIDQPPGSLVTHLGVYCEQTFDGVGVLLGPLGMELDGGDRPVLAFALTSPNYDPAGLLLNPLTATDRLAVKQQVELAGGKPAGEWASTDGLNVSVALDNPIGDGVQQALERYLTDCPRHETVFCSNDIGCDWYRLGRDRLVRPPGWR